MSCYDCGYEGIGIHKGPKHCISYMRAVLAIAKADLATLNDRVRRLEIRA